MRHRLIAAAAALCALLAFTPAASAATKQTSLSGAFFIVEGGTRVNAIAVIGSASERCVRGRKVVFKAELGDGSLKPLGSDVTSRNGGAVSVGQRLPNGAVEIRAKAAPTKVSKRLKCGKASANLNQAEAVAR